MKAENDTKPWKVQVGRGGGTAYESQHTNRPGAEQQARALTNALGGDDVSLWHWDGQRWQSIDVTGRRSR